ncbi:MAG: hypothetical protein AAB332_02845 [Planctomycetota bacterium]
MPIENTDIIISTSIGIYNIYETNTSVESYGKERWEGQKLVS